jgi:hypothetical protein
MNILSQTVLRRFESLGDNCEFGFVQRRNDYEDGGFLRWSISPLDKLITCFEARFKDLYLFENLKPSAPDMVQDVATGLIFHTRMRSNDGQFLLEEQQRRDIYTHEKHKIDYLLDKFLSKIQRADTICVYKRNSGMTDNEAMRLKQSMNSISWSNLLIIKSTDDRSKWSTVEGFGSGLFVGFIDEFAPYSAADHVSLAIWNQLIQNAACQINS